MSMYYQRTTEVRTSIHISPFLNKHISCHHRHRQLSVTIHLPFHLSDVCIPLKMGFNLVKLFFCIQKYSVLVLSSPTTPALRLQIFQSGASSRTEGDSDTGLSIHQRLLSNWEGCFKMEFYSTLQHINISKLHAVLCTVVQLIS